jgi:hypothetical protein
MVRELRHMRAQSVGRGRQKDTDDHCAFSFWSVLTFIFPSGDNCEMDGCLGLVRVASVKVILRFTFPAFFPWLQTRDTNMYATCIPLSPVAAQHIRAFLAWNHETASSVLRVSTLHLSCFVHCFGFGSSIEVPPWLAFGKWQERCGLP